MIDDDNPFGERNFRFLITLAAVTLIMEGLLIGWIWNG